MLCPRCHAANPEGALFCMKCGQSLAGIPVAAPVATGPVEGSEKKKQTGWLAAIFAALILILLALLFLLWPRPVLQAEQKTPPPAEVLKIVKAPAEAKAKMPQDVANWLAFLKTIEDRRRALSNRQQAEMMVFYQKLSVAGPGLSEVDPSAKPEDSPGSVSQDKFKDMLPEWEKLLKDYQAVPAPAECKPIADAYDQAMEEIPGMISDLQGILNQAESSPTDALTKLNSMQGTSSKIDLAFQTADQGIDEICRKYEVAKWFGVGDSTGGLLGKSQGLPTVPDWARQAPGAP